MRNSYHNYCPQCQSENISSFEKIYQNGVSKIKHTHLAEHQVAPPKTSGSSYLFAFMGIFISGLVFVIATTLSGIILANSLSKYTDTYSISIGTVLAIIVGTVYFLSFIKRNSIEKKIWQSKYEQWKKGWMCLKCSNSWYLS